MSDPAQGSYMSQDDLQSYLGFDFIGAKASPTLGKLCPAIDTDTGALKSGGDPDPDQVQEIIDLAEGEVNSYLVKRGYSIPVGSYGDSALLKRLSIACCLPQLMGRKPAMAATWSYIYEHAKKDLEAIGEGKLPLDLATPPPTTNIISGSGSLDVRIMTVGTEGEDSTGETSDTLGDF